MSIKGVSLDSGMTEEGTKVMVLRLETDGADTESGKPLLEVFLTLQGKLEPPPPAKVETPAPANGRPPRRRRLAEVVEEYGASNLQRKPAEEEHHGT